MGQWAVGSGQVKRSRKGSLSVRKTGLPLR